jgi:hypothetical protein
VYQNTCKRKCSLTYARNAVHFMLKRKTVGKAQINILNAERPSGYLTYHDVQRSQILRSIHTMHLPVVYDWVLHHDNAPAYTALSIREFLAKKSIPVLPNPLNSPDLAPCDFHLFPKFKSRLKGLHRWATHTYRKWLPVLLWSVEKTLEPLCNLPRVILWRR